ncbi:MAG: hypothetical protein VB934_03615 [Polyangiaceae bacterium]
MKTRILAPLAVGMSLAVVACGGGVTSPVASPVAKSDAAAAAAAADGAPGSPAHGAAGGEGARSAAKDPKSTAPSGSPHGDLGAHASDQAPDDVVAVPGERVFLARWNTPAATFGTLLGFTTVPAEVAALLPQELAKDLIGSVRRYVDRRAFAETVAIDAPLDLVVVVDTTKSRRMPKPMLGYSIGLRSLDEARKAVTSELSPMGKQMWLIGPKDGYGTRCAIAASTGSTRARLVCGDRMRDLEKLGAYLARTLPTVTTPDVDMYAAFELSSVLDRYGPMLAAQAKGLPIFARELKIGVPIFDDAIMNAAAAVADDLGLLLEDADSIIAKVDVDATKGLKLSIGAQFAGSKSWTVHTLVDGAHLSSTAPEMFWRLPKSALSVVYGHGGDPAGAGGILTTLQALAEGTLEKAGVFSSRDRRDIAALLRNTAGKYETVVQAQGQFGTLLGWYLVGSEGSAQRTRAWLNDFVSIYNRATVQAELRRLVNREAKGLKMTLPTVRKVPSPRGLGAGALTVRVAFQIPKPMLRDLKGIEGLELPPSGTVEVYLMSAKDAKGHWFAFGSERQGLAKLIRNARAGKNAIRGSKQLESFNRDRHNLAGALMLRGLLDKLVRKIAARKPNDPKVKKARAILKGLPNKGETPIVFVGDVKAGARPKASMSLQLGRGSLVDLGWLVSKGYEEWEKARAASKGKALGGPVGRKR